MQRMHMIVAICAVVIGMGIATQVHAATIGNTVWNDRNGNHVQDPGEEGIAGVRIKLYHGDDVDTDRTNSHGRYEFDDLEPGHYTVVVAQETLPRGCRATYDRDGNKNGTYSDKYLQEDDNFTHADFGYQCTNTVAYVRRVSPVTGPGMVSVIIATAVAIAAGMYMYRRYTIKKLLQK
ncbi:MAG: SdrD B-like domain-containing protein [Parcubacteria group bacterium]